MGQADQVYTVANKEVGYHEGYSDGHWNNWQKYSPAVPGLEWSQNQAWCQTFQSWIFQTAGVKPLAPVTASCATAVNWYKSRNRFSYYPAAGAMVFFGSGGGSHVGFVYKYDADYVYTVEGNTNASGGAEGDGVYSKKRSRRDAYTYGYGYPAYAEGIVSADPKWGGKASASLNLVTPPPADTGAPWVSLIQVVWAANSTRDNQRRVAPGDANPRDDVLLIMESLHEVNGYEIVEPGIYSPELGAKYAEWQKSLGYTGSDADGVPGLTSLTKLAQRTGKFQVRDTTGTYVPVYTDVPAEPPVDPGPTTPDESPSTPATISPRDVTYQRFTGTINSDIFKKACAAAGVTYSSYWENGYKVAAGRESSGNANACNLWDSNAINPSGYSSVKDYGDGYSRTGVSKLNGSLAPFQCSRGYVQCIPQTFAQYHAPNTSTNIYDPIANVAASIRYVRKVYGVNMDGSNLASRVQQFDPSRPPKGY